MTGENNFRDSDFKDVDNTDKLIRYINDADFTSFFKDSGDGYYFDRSLHFYGCTNKNKFHDYEFRTNLINRFYGEILEEDSLISFGEDVFGNQFVFYSKGIGLFMLETAEIEYISANFRSFLEKVFIVDRDYYSGESLVKQLIKNERKLDFHERLNPKIPFVLGGEFKLDNLYRMTYKEITEYNSSIAIQIKNLPDGEEIQIKTD